MPSSVIRLPVGAIPINCPWCVLVLVPRQRLPTVWSPATCSTAAFGICVDADLTSVGFLKKEFHCIVVEMRSPDETRRAKLGAYPERVRIFTPCASALDKIVKLRSIGEPTLGNHRNEKR
jgi:hypothetical protein